MSGVNDSKGKNYAAVALDEPSAEAVCISSSPVLDVPAAVTEQVVLVAPSNMPGGYQFAAIVNGVTVTVKVVSFAYLRDPFI
jgi:hypothetical protein